MFRANEIGVADLYVGEALPLKGSPDASWLFEAFEASVDRLAADSANESQAAELGLSRRGKSTRPIRRTIRTPKKPSPLVENSIRRSRSQKRSDDSV